MNIPSEKQLSTPWVAGSNPAGIASETAEKSPMNTGFLHFGATSDLDAPPERKGIKAKPNAPKRHPSPGKIPGLVSPCETDRVLACQQART
jgi:hypothetical protein